jgi:DNA-binding MarR family transcriptional regulator
MLSPNNNKIRDSQTTVSQILRLSEEIFKAIKLSIPPEWLMSDMTVAQLRVLLLLHTEGPSRMSSIANTLGIAVSTATGIIDNLVKKDLVTRRDYAEDRRVVICSLSTQGQQTINSMWALGQQQMEKLLRGLSPEQLRKAKEVAEFLLHNAQSQSEKPKYTLK